MARLGLAGVLLVMTGIASLLFYGSAVLGVKRWATWYAEWFAIPAPTWGNLVLPQRWRRTTRCSRRHRWGTLLFVGWCVWSLIDTFVVAGQMICR